MVLSSQESMSDILIPYLKKVLAPMFLVIPKHGLC